MLFCLLSLVPGNDWRETDLVHARKEGERGEDERGPDELILVEEGNELKWLAVVSCVLFQSFAAMRVPFPSTSP
jgi:hypothetical protein